MVSTWHEQLAAIPIKRPTTVLRIDLSMGTGEECFARTRELIEAWWRGKAERHGLITESPSAATVLQNERCRAEVFRQQDSYALALEEIEPQPREPRDWITDVALTAAKTTQLSLRLSYRQPLSLAPLSGPRAPRFLRDIVELGYSADQWPLSSSARVVGEQDFPAFLSLLTSADRTLPVVVVSEDWRTDEVYTDVSQLAQFLSGVAHVVRLKTEATWLLSSELGREWSTFQGAIRCYNPKLDIRGEKYKHRLWLAESIQRLAADARDGFLNACLRHVFTAVNADFESRTLLTPGSLRRQQPTALVTEAAPGVMEVYADEIARTSPAAAEAATSPEAAEFHAQLQEQLRISLELASQVQQLTDSTNMLERDLQEERAAHADTKKSRQEDREYLQLFESDEHRDTQLRRLLSGDVSGESSEALKPLWMEFGPFFRSLQNVSSHVRSLEDQLEQERGRAEAEQQRTEQAEEERRQLRGKLVASESRFAATRVSPSESASLRELLPRLVTPNPCLADVLSAVENTFPERVTVLATARQSANRASEFLHGRKAFHLLWRLVTDYWRVLQTGGGDAIAKDVFGENYAPRESSKLSKEGESRRTFTYEGEATFMEKHLKIGTADNAAETLRVHFHWDSERSRLAIGHCGCHLDF